MRCGLDKRVVRRLAALLTFFVCAAGAAAADTPRYAVATVQTLDGSVNVMRDAANGMVMFLPDDPARA